MLPCGHPLAASAETSDQVALAGAHRVVEECLEGGETCLVHRRAGLPAVADRRLPCVVGPGERAGRGVVGEAGRRVGPRGGVRGLGLEGGGGVVRLTERREGNHAHGVVAARRCDDDLLGIGAGSRGGDGVALRVEEVDVEVGGCVGPADLDHEVVVGAVAGGRAHVEGEVVAGGRQVTARLVEDRAGGVGGDERAAGPGRGRLRVRDRGLGRGGGVRSAHRQACGEQCTESCEACGSGSDQSTWRHHELRVLSRRRRGSPVRRHHWRPT